MRQRAAKMNCVYIYTRSKYYTIQILIFDNNHGAFILKINRVSICIYARAEEINSSSFIFNRVFNEYFSLKDNSVIRLKLKRAIKY